MNEGLDGIEVVHNQTEMLEDILVVVSLLGDDTELNGAVEGGGLRAGKGVLLVVAGEGGLVEDGAVAADKAPLGGLDHRAGIILNGEADVEDLAGVGDIGVVAILLALTGEAEIKRSVEEGLGIGGELVALVGGSVVLGHGEVASNAGGEDDGGLGEHDEEIRVVFVLDDELLMLCVQFEN